MKRIFIGIAIAIFLLLVLTVFTLTPANQTTTPPAPEPISPQDINQTTNRTPQTIIGQWRSVGVQYECTANFEESGSGRVSCATPVIPTNLDIMWRNGASEGEYLITYDGKTTGVTITGNKLYSGILPENSHMVKA